MSSSSLVHPFTRNGTVTLGSANPLAQPAANLRSFSRRLGLVTMRGGIRFADDFVSSEFINDTAEAGCPGTCRASQTRT